MALTPNTNSAQGGGSGSPFQGVTAPGRVIETTQRYHTPSGQVRELRKRVITLQNAPGIFRTDDLIEVIPPLACSCLPENMNDLAECSRCLSLTCASKHSQTCPLCGRPHCSACLTKLATEEGTIVVCVTCADQAKRPLLTMMKKLIWG